MDLSAFDYYTISINFAVGSFFMENKILLIYLAIINVATFFEFAIDKHNAVHKKNRIRVTTLLSLSFIGGSIGGLLAMYLFHHKTKKKHFTVGLPLMLIMQMIVLFFLMSECVK